MKYLLLSLLFFLPLCAMAQDEYPIVEPSAAYLTSEGEDIDDASQGQSAPLEAHFKANPRDVGTWDARYEWKIYAPGQEETPLVHRFEEDIDYTFTQSGTFCVQLYATFTLGGDTIQYPGEGEANPFMVTISESKLEFPNAFSPNGDGYNDVYKAKDGYQSIVQFEAAIFNRWGHKLFSWTDPAKGWDGRAGGKTVKDGVYFVVVKAKGADGRKFNIRRDVNVLTGYENNETTGEQ